MTTFCTLLFLIACHPQKAPTALFVADAGLGLADVRITQTSYYHPWFYETDPLARPFLHLPEPALDTVTVAADLTVAQIGMKMRRSHRWYRHIWWVPQVAVAGAHVWGIQQTIRLR